MPLPAIAAIAIFAATYLGMAVGRLPGLTLDRPAIALIGAALMIAVGAIPLADALRAIDLDTLALLLGMMILAAELRLSGFFDLVAGWAMAHARAPLSLLAAVVAASGLFSAFLVNDTVCLVMAPLVIEVARALRRRPLPYLLATAMAANVGSVATITGNPQNMIVGVASRVPYPAFAAALAPIAVAGLVIVFGAVALICRGDLGRDGPAVGAAASAGTVAPWRLAAAAFVTLGVVTLFLAGVPVAEAALIGGAVVLLARGGSPAALYRAIDGPLLLMFAGLFVVVAAAQRALLTPETVAAVRGLALADPWVLTVVTAALSNLVSNVPAVLVLKPFVPGLADSHRAWLVIAMSATLAGNLTLVGSIANLIVAERARAEAVAISLWAYCRVGIPVTLVTLAFGAWWLG
jgi:Na+/H+ antiporter NhaD/arsenite permease-like protein